MSQLKTALGIKLVGSALLFACALTGGISWFGIHSGTKALTEQASESLVAIRRSRQRTIEEFFRLTHQQAASFAQLGTTVEAARAFTFGFLARPNDGAQPTSEVTSAKLTAFYADESEVPELSRSAGSGDGQQFLPSTRAGALLQIDYIVDNPHPQGTKDQLVAAASGAQYDRTHERYHPALSQLTRDFGFYDLFLFDMEGNLVYSVKKETDFATNVLTGPHRESGLAQAYVRARNTADFNSTHLVDFRAYRPSNNEPQSFIAAPLVSDGRKVGVLALQMPLDRINSTMAGTEGLGMTGETFLMGTDLIMRTQSRFLGDEAVLRQSAGDGIAAVRHDAVGRFTDYRGFDTLWSLAPLAAAGLDWIIVAKQDYAEITAPARALRKRVAVFGGLLLLLLGALGYEVISRVVLKPVRTLSLGAKRVTEGDYTHPVAVASHDELGELGQAFNHMTTAVQNELTRQKETQAVLAERELQIRTIVQNIPGATYRYHNDHEWQLVFMSEGIKAIAGYEAAGFLGEGDLSLQQITHPDDQQRVMNEISTALSKSDNYSIEHRIAHRDGSQRWVLQQAHLTRDDANEIRWLDGCLFDIHARKLADEGLKRAQRLMQGVFDSSNSLIYIKDLEGRYLSVNRKWSQYCGIERDEAINKLPSELFEPELAAGIEATDTRVRESGSPQLSEDIVPGPHGVRTYIANRFALLDADGNVFATAGVSADVTELKAVERELREAREQAESANRTKSAFLANMSHELRTPMNAIIGYSEMLIEEAEDLGQEDFVPDLEKIRGAGRHLLELINDILDLSKIEAGRIELFIEKFDVASLVDDVVATVPPLIEKNSNTLKVQIAESAGTMDGDVTRIRQCLLNLLSNAAKFTSDGEITLSVESDGDERLRFSVADNGIGIAADKLTSLFDEFTQADASTTRQYGGTGLGLAITRRLCQIMDGDISVTSTAGVGSCFTITLPRHLPTQPQAATPSENAAETFDELNSDGALILVIDDDAAARELLTRTLLREGYRVATAADGDEGLRLAHELHPTAITLDVIMPGKDGWSVLRELKADDVLCDIPVILSSMVDDRNLGYTLGATEYLTKPLDRNKLLKILNGYASDVSPCTALIVEDDAQAREIQRHLLEQAGWRVVEAVNGRDGLDALASIRPQLVMLDLMMPVMDGFEFIVEMRQQAQWRGIPVIVVTAKNLNAEERAQLCDKVERIVEKGSMSCDELLDIVRATVAECAGK